MVDGDVERVELALVADEAVEEVWEEGGVRGEGQGEGEVWEEAEDVGVVDEEEGCEGEHGAPEDGGHDLKFAR